MFAPVLAVFYFGMLVAALVWAAFAVLNFWIWSKSKATGNLLMLIAGGWFALSRVLWSFGTMLLGWENFQWTELIGIGLLTAGFYLSVKPMVEAQIAALQAKVKGMGHKEGGTTPPPAATPPK